VRTSASFFRCQRDQARVWIPPERPTPNIDFTRVVRLSFLAPDITQAILDGHQPRDLTAEKLLEHSRLPLACHDQRTALGFA
jgi:hypothetical protein